MSEDVSSLCAMAVSAMAGADGREDLSEEVVVPTEFVAAREAFFVAVVAIVERVSGILVAGVVIALSGRFSATKVGEGVALRWLSVMPPTTRSSATQAAAA